MPELTLASMPSRTVSRAGLQLRQSAVYAAAMVVLAIALSLAFEAGLLLPTSLGVLGLFSLAGWGLWRMQLVSISPLARLMTLLYFMPFTLCWGHLWDEHYAWWYTPLSQRFIDNPAITSGMVMVGLIGLAALLCGLWLARLRADWRLTTIVPPPARTLDPLSFVALLLVAYFFCAISTPDETIFSAVYTAAMGVAGQINFNAGSTVGYVLVTLLWVDSEQEVTRPLLRFYKRVGIAVLTVFILIFLQLLRGDRDSFGLVVALAALFATEPRRLAKGIDVRPRVDRLLLIGACGSMVLVSFLAIATFRTRLAEGESRPFLQAVVQGYNESTWGGVLLTNLSLAAQYHEGRMETEYGLTYLDYVYSLPPGFITYALGVQRPIEPDQGPNFWFTDVSSGGVHVVTVAFKNFHTPGVVVVLCLYGYLIGRAEIGSRRTSWLARLWYGTFFVGSAQWFWYGDMPFIRAVMACALASIVYIVVRHVLGLAPATAPRFRATR